MEKRAHSKFQFNVYDKLLDVRQKRITDRDANIMFRKT